VLIGENNSGKTNILRTLNLALGETWPTERHFSEEDFYNQETGNDIVIQIYFDTTIEEWRNKHKIEIGGIELRCKAYKRAVKGKPAGTLKTDYYCITSDGNQARYPSEPFEKGQQFKGYWMPYRVTNEIREMVPFIYVDVLRDYSKQSPGSRWSILRRLFNEVNKEFSNDKKKIAVKSADGSSVKMSRRDAFEHTVKQAYQYLRTDGFVEIEKKLAENAIEQMGLDRDESKIELHFESHDPTNVYKSLQLYVDQMGIQSPAGEVGAGLQSAIVMAIFRTYEELKKEGAVFAIEEPEVFLHPQKARYFSSVLQSLAEKGSQMLITTHSPIFVQIHNPESIAIVRRTNETGTVIEQTEMIDIAPDQRKELQLLSEFDSQRNELFFSKRAVFVEGNTEKVSIPLVFKALGFDINKENISIVECGGKTKIPLFVRVAKALHIPYVVIADHDIKEIKEEWSDKRKEKQNLKNKNHKKWNKDIIDVAGEDKVFFLYPDFESELGLSKDESMKVEQALNMFAGITKEDLPECLMKPIKYLMTL